MADAVVRTLDRRYPGLAAQVEMTDVSTPATLVRYTGNWQGSFEGGLPSGPMSARQVQQLICRSDGVKFRTSVA